MSLVGVVLVTTAAIMWVFLLPLLIKGESSNPYIGIPGFLLFPGIFIFGLILIPAGISWRRTRLRHQGVMSSPELTLDSPWLRRLIAFVAATTGGSLIIVSTWGYSAVNYMDIASFLWPDRFSLDACSERVNK